jgi:MFS transporter, SHS family, lactate transporter
MPQNASTPADQNAMLRRIILAGFAGWTLDAFDFFLVVLCLTDIGSTFGASDTAVSASLLVTLAFRPIGALIFGWMADRYGRRLPLMLNLVFFSVIEVCTGLSVNFTQFLILRALFGIGMGGEWGVGTALVMEHVPVRWRGIVAGLLQEGYAAGYLLAAAAYWFVLPHFGWRVLFFIGGVPALLALYIRVGIPESPIWREQQANRAGAAIRPAALLQHWKLFLYLTVLMAMMNFSSHGTQDMYPTFLKRYWLATPGQTALITVIAMIGAITGGVCFGLVSDRLGRRRTMMIALGLAILMTPLWAYAPALALLGLGAFLMQFMVQGAWGVVPAHLAELSPDDVRGFLPGFAYQCGALLAGSAAWIEASLARHMPYNQTMAICASVIFIIAIVVIFAGPERHQRPFGDSST